jgi:ATP-dependent Lhr-like helicase
VETGNVETGALARLVERSSTIWERLFHHLQQNRRATLATAAGQSYWVAAERSNAFVALFHDATFQSSPAEIGEKSISQADALVALNTGWLGHIGPTTATELGGLLGISSAEIEKALLLMEASGAILRGKFTAQKAAEPRTTEPAGAPVPTRPVAAPTPTPANETEWCDRRLLARIHRLTVATLRKQIQPVTAAQFMRWLLRWQHVAPESQVQGERATLEVLRQLEGFEVPANAWERQVLSRRIADYDPKWLDQLCLTGAVGWGRLSPHPATLESSNGDQLNRRRVIPTSVAPITFFIREQSDWMAPHASLKNAQGLSPVANQIFELLRQRGASFFADIVRATGKLKAEIETGLWELVAAGLVTADGFDNLRALIDPKRRAGQGNGKAARPRHSSGRWAILHADSAVEHERRTEAVCWMLLKRYGVVFRDLLVRESNLPKWRELQLAFRRLESRGEIRGGRFVDGFLGEQFALPVAVESLRATRKLPPTGELVTISAADPLNLVGVIVPGERIPAISGRYLSYRDGVAVEAEALTQSKVVSL